jgi:hypothetical protein
MTPRLRNPYADYHHSSAVKSHEQNRRPSPPGAVKTHEQPQSADSSGTAHESPRPGGSSLPPAWLLIICRYISLVTPATGTSLMQPKPGMRHARPQ